MRMRIINKMLFVVITMIIFTACAPLKTPVVMKYASIEKYKYAYIIPTKELTSSSGGTFGGMYGIYGLSTTKSVNPSDVISGILIKEGFIILPELKSELSHETIVVNYGVQFISADTNELLCSCTGEGQGETDADDIRQAINNALSSLFFEYNDNQF